MEAELRNLADSTKHSWTGTVRLANGLVMDIWYTAWPMMSRYCELLSLASDYPKHEKSDPDKIR